MALWARMAMVLERGVVTNGTLNLNSTDDAATNMLINDLVFAQSKSVRTSTIILASFNVLASFATAFSILYDCYWASKRCNPKFRASQFCISTMHPAETFPLVLSFGIIVQGLVFAAAQGQGMQMLFTDAGCDIIAQYMLPALFMVPFIQAVFGLECALRSLRRLPFQARGKYDVTICLVVIILMLIGSWIPTFIFKEPAVCFASLVWFVSAFGTTTFLTLLIAACLMIISAITIFARLSSVTLVDQHQRIAASRMVYYLVLGIMSLALVVPYFATQAMMTKGDLKLAMIATVVLNLSGLMNGLLHLFLRSNTSTSSFGPKHSRHWARDKHEIRLWGPNELAFTNHLVDPVSGPQSPQSSAEKLRSESQTNLVGNEKVGMSAMSSPPFRSPGRTPPFPITPIKAVATSSANAGLTRQVSTKQHGRKQSYSLFPVDDTKSSTRPITAAGSIYDITHLEPPPRIKFGPGHRRDSSVISTATVQIGLRLSHAPETEPMPLPTTTFNRSKPVLSSNSLLLPIAFGAPVSPSASSNMTTLSARTFGSPPAAPGPSQTTLSPKKFTPPSRKAATNLQVITSVTNTPRSQTPELPLRSPRRPSPMALIASALTPKSAREDGTPKFDKDLPPTPPAQLNPIVAAIRGSNTQLTTAIYSPSNQSDKKMEQAILNGLPSGPKSSKTPTSAGLFSPSSSNIKSPKRGDENTEKRDWI